MNSFSIQEGRLEDVVSLLKEIPEFEQTPDATSIQDRINHVPHLVLTAYEGTIPVGFKIGYEREGRFYSWLGAILPPYRQSGLASALADYQENWARQNGYKSIWMKTRNCFPEMLLMAVRRGFRITSMDPREDLRQNRIILEKTFLINTVT